MKLFVFGKGEGSCNGVNRAFRICKRVFAKTFSWRYFSKSIYFSEVERSHTYIFSYSKVFHGGGSRYASLAGVKNSSKTLY